MWDALFARFNLNRRQQKKKPDFNRQFPSSPVPLFQSESKCETFHMKMSSTRRFFFMQIKVIFIRMVSHLDSLWSRGTRELGNGLSISGSSMPNYRDQQFAWISPILTCLTCTLGNSVILPQEILRVLFFLFSVLLLIFLIFFLCFH